MSEDSEKHYSSATHHRVQRSTTLNRKYVHRPAGRIKQIEQSDSSNPPEISSFAKCQAANMRRRQELAERINRERLAAMKQKSSKRRQITVQSADPIEPTRPAKPTEDWATMPKAPSARELKDEAIKKAMRSVATMEAADQKSRKKAVQHKKARRVRRIITAVACSLAAVAGIGYFVSTNLPDVSVRVTAMQTGISDPYPSYIPRGFSLVTSTSNDSSIQMIFADQEGHKFTLSEEKSSWDSKALVSGYVEKKWSNYDSVKEQGLTIYIWGSNAAWVNGGVKYTIEADNGTLTNKQIKSIATSL